MTERQYAVAIDGPSGAGKSTLARAAAFAKEKTTATFPKGKACTALAQRKSPIAFKAPYILLCC